MSRRLGTPNNELPQDFRLFIEQLNHYQVEYMLIGGYAVGAYGHARATGDLDVFINATPANAQRMRQACVAYGISEKDIQQEMFLVPRMVVLGEPPLRIEVLKKLDAVDFPYANARATTVQLSDLPVRVIGLSDLILLKRAAVKGRSEPRDTEDLSYLQKLAASSPSKPSLVERLKSALSLKRKKGD